MSDAVIYRPLGGRGVTAGFGTLRAGAEGVSVIGARTDIAGTVELHTHTMDDTGKMAMRRVEDFAVEAGGTRELRRGGDHIMFFAVSPDLPAKGETVDVMLSLRRQDGSVYEVVVPFRVTEFD
jgi:copper(I)-binding protein